MSGAESPDIQNMVRAGFTFIDWPLIHKIKGTGTYPSCLLGVVFSCDMIAAGIFSSYQCPETRLMLLGSLASS